MNAAPECFLSLIIGAAIWLATCWWERRLKDKEFQSRIIHVTKERKS